MLLRFISDGQGGSTGYQRRTLEIVLVTARAMRPVQTDIRPGQVGSASEKL